MKQTLLTLATSLLCALILSSGCKKGDTTQPPGNNAPTTPSNPNPVDSATGVSRSPVLSWSCSDPDGDSLTYDVYFGTDNPLATKVSLGQQATTLGRSGLTGGTIYYWKIVARDSRNNATTGPVWSLTTWGPTGNLLTNGSFEQGPVVGTYLPLDSGSTAINGWVVSRGPIDLVVYWQNYHGSRSIDLNGTPGRGGIKQTFSTANGATYRVRFAFAGNPEGAPTIKTMDVSAAGSSAQFIFDVTGKTITNMGWQIETWDFVAIGPSTTLEFYSTIIPLSIYGPAIDNVWVERVL